MDTSTSSPANTVAHVLGSVRLGPVRREPEVDRDPALVRDHVAGHPAGDADRVEPLPVGAAVDVHRRAARTGQPGQHRRGGVDRVDAEPGPGAVRAPAPGA